MALTQQSASGGSITLDANGSGIVRYGLHTWQALNLEASNVGESDDGCARVHLTQELGAENFVNKNMETLRAVCSPRHSRFTQRSRS